MKHLLALTILAVSFSASVASAASQRSLICTYTDLDFGAKPQIEGVFEFETIQGKLERAEGVFKASNTGIMVNVKSVIIPLKQTREVLVKTEMEPMLGTRKVKAKFSSNFDDQDSYLEIDNRGIIACKVE